MTDCPVSGGILDAGRFRSDGSIVVSDGSDVRSIACLDDDTVVVTGVICCCMTAPIDDVLPPDLPITNDDDEDADIVVRPVPAKGRKVGAVSAASVLSELLSCVNSKLC